MKEDEDKKIVTDAKVTDRRLLRTQNIEPRREEAEVLEEVVEEGEDEEDEALEHASRSQHSVMEATLQVNTS